MTTNQSQDERQANRAKANKYRFVKNHDYAPDDFAKRGEITFSNGMRVVDESGSGESEEFENFEGMHLSNWVIHWTSGARLSDGTILYEGRQ
jgi:hypothetical protein